MSRVSGDEMVDGRLMNGYDYERQAWVVEGRYVACSHSTAMTCGCYGREHVGEETLTEN